MSKLFGKSKQAYYKYDENVVLRKAAREAFVIEYVRGIRAIDPGIGGPKLWLMYKREFGDNDTVGRDTFEDILDRNNCHRLLLVFVNRLLRYKKLPSADGTDGSEGMMETATGVS